MHRISFISIFFVIFKLCDVFYAEAANCGGGDPCIFVNRDIGWIPREESLTQSKPPPVVSDSWNRSDTTLFVAISSFRDRLCPITLFNMFTKAAHPERITVAVVQQNIPGDIDCFDEYCNLMRKHLGKEPETDWCPHSGNIKMKRLDGNSAMGPTWARSFGSKMVEDEEFCMQTDSHMDFMIGWDSLMMQMWSLTENEYGVLSTYVTDSQDFDRIKDKSKGINGLHEVPHLCIVKFHGVGGMPRNYGTKCMRMFPQPKLTNAVWGAGLSFAKCHAEKKVPYDPYTPGIFDGEEWSRAARYWTWGYDIYTPNRVYISHNYKGSQSDPLHSRWHSNPRKSGNTLSLADAQSRLRMLLHMDGDKENATLGEQVRRGRYGLGDRRSFEQLVEFSGIDPRTRQTIRDRCGNIEYVPFKEHPLGPKYIPQFDPVTFQPLDEPDEGSVYYDPLRVAKGTHSPIKKLEMKQKRLDVLASGGKNVEETMRASSSVGGNVAVKEPTKAVTVSLVIEIVSELSVLFGILLGLYYCFVPSRATKKL